MASSLLDDIATVLDDVSVMTKVAAKKTAGVLGDDLALNAQQVSGVAAARELPVVWAVARGALGGAILRAAPYLMKGLSVAGTAAMFLIGGGILAHGVPPVHHAAQALAEGAGPLRAVVSLAADGVIGIAAGALVLGMVSVGQRRRHAPAAG